MFSKWFGALPNWFYEFSYIEDLLYLANAALTRKLEAQCKRFRKPFHPIYCKDTKTESLESLNYAFDPFLYIFVSFAGGGPSYAYFVRHSIS